MSCGVPPPEQTHGWTLPLCSWGSRATSLVCASPTLVSKAGAIYTAQGECAGQVFGLQDVLEGAAWEIPGSSGFFAAPYPHPWLGSVSPVRRQF